MKLDILMIMCGASAIGCAYLGSKVRKLSKTIDSSVEDLSKKTSLEVSQSIVDAAVKKAVDDYASKTADDIADQLTESMSKKINSSVDSTVQKLKNQQADEIAMRLKNEVLKISESDIQEEVTRRVKDALVDRFKKDVDGISKDYRESLRKNLTKSEPESWTIKFGK